MSKHNGRNKNNNKPKPAALHRPFVDYFLEHPKVSAFIACIALAVTFSGRISVLGLIFSLLVAAIFALAFIKGLTIPTVYKYLAAALILLGLAILGKWLDQSRPQELSDADLAAGKISSKSPPSNAPNAQVTARTSQRTSAPHPTMAPESGYAVKFSGNASNNVIEHLEVYGFNNGVRFSDAAKGNKIGSAALHTTPYEETTLLQEWKQKLTTDAGDATKIGDDLDWMRSKLEILWQNSSADEIHRKRDAFAIVDQKLRAAASNRDELLKLLPHIAFESQPHR